MKKVIALMLAMLLALSMLTAFAAEYTDKNTVKKVQQALNDAGYNCGTPDGAAGKKTKAAITGYQTDKGLSVTGVIDDELLISLGLAEEEEASAGTGEDAGAGVVGGTGTRPSVLSGAGGNVFTMGNPLVLFDEQGVRLTLTGEVEDKGGSSIGLKAVFDNETDVDLSLKWKGSVNGIDFKEKFISFTNTEAGQSNEFKLPIQRDDFDLFGYEDLASMNVVFTVNTIEITSSSSSSSSASASDSSSSGSVSVSVSSSSSASASASTSKVTGTYAIIKPVEVTFGDHQEISGERPFEELPDLPHPSNFISVKVTGNSSSSSNGRVTSASYTFAPKEKGDDAAKLLQAYLAALGERGLTTVEKDGEYLVSKDGFPLAKIVPQSGSFQLTLIL